jgi:hypothetical protein
VRFNTSRELRWQTDSRRCHINWVILDSEWEGEFCRVAEAHPRVRAYVKNHNLGLEVPYRYGSETRKYLPDFIVLVEDGHGEGDLLRLIVEIKGYRREDAKDKKLTMESYWIPGVNHLRAYGRWAFAEFGDIYEMEFEFKKKVESEFNQLIAAVISNGSHGSLLSPIESFRQRTARTGQIREIGDELWRSVEGSPSRRLSLSTVVEIADRGERSIGDVLGVLGLMSAPSSRLLRLEMREQSTGQEVSDRDLVNRLRSWWRDKTLSDEEWKDWASRVNVSWVAWDDGKGMV